MIELLPGPSYIAANGDAVITVGSHNGDAYRGTLIDRLQHIGARQGIGRIKALALHHHAARHGEALRPDRLLGELLATGVPGGCKAAKGWVGKGVVWGKRGSVRLEIGGGETLKK